MPKIALTVLYKSGRLVAKNNVRSTTYRNFIIPRSGNELCFSSTKQFNIKKLVRVIVLRSEMYNRGTLYFNCIELDVNKIHKTVNADRKYRVDKFFLKQTLHFVSTLPS